MSHSEKPSKWARRRARQALVQAVYQWQVSSTEFTQLRQEFEASGALRKADAEFFADRLGVVVRHSDELDELFGPLLDRPLEQLDLVERAVLRLAAAELRDRIDVPYRVVIDEYVELTKTFGAQDAFRYINGVLDKLSESLRSIEVQVHSAHPSK